MARQPKRKWGKWVLQTRGFRSIHNKQYWDYWVNVDRINTPEDLRMMIAHLREKTIPVFDAENAVAALKELCVIDDRKEKLCKPH